MSCDLVSIPEMISFTSISFLNSVTSHFSFSCFSGLGSHRLAILSTKFLNYFFQSAFYSWNYFITFFLFKLQLGYFLLPCGNIFLSFFSYVKCFYILLVYSFFIQKLNLFLHIIHFQRSWILLSYYQEVLRTEEKAQGTCLGFFSLAEGSLFCFLKI